MTEQQTRERAEPRARRPLMKDYGIETVEEGMLPWSWAAEQIEHSRNYWIGTTRPDGRPHAAPVWGVWLDGTLYFSTGTGSRKGRNLQASPELVVHLESGDDVVILEGMVEPMTDPALLARFADVYDAKYNFRPDVSKPEGYYAVRHRIAYAWREQDFPKSATRWVFEEQ